MQFVGGLIQEITGVVQVMVGIFTGFFTVLRDIFTGNWANIGNDLRAAWATISAGLNNIVQGMWHMIEGIFQASIGSILGFMKGFVNSILSVFGLLPSGAGAQMDLMKTQAEMKTAEMRVNTTSQTLAMAQSNIHNLELQRLGIIAQIQQTTDPAVRHMLDMKLQSALATEQMQVGVVQHLDLEWHPRLLYRALEWHQGHGHQHLEQH